MSTLIESPVVASAEDLPPLTCLGETIHPQHVGRMRDSSPLLQDPAAMRRRIQAEGYLYLPGLLGRERVKAARRVVLEKMAARGQLDPAADLMDAIPAGRSPGFDGGNLATMFEQWQTIHDVLYTGPMIEAFTALFGAPVDHFDFTWMRIIGPGPATPLHADIVYMGRGTHQLYTAWTPLGDNGFDLGGLLVLEGSNNHTGLAKQYFKHDVDSFCENRPDQRDAHARQGGYLKGGVNRMRDSIGGIWRTADYKMGDVVLFHTYTVHGGTDNRSDRLRLSCDTRYQPAGTQRDERWIGANPIAHGPDGKRGRIC